MPDPDICVQFRDHKFETLLILFFCLLLLLLLLLLLSVSHSQWLLGSSFYVCSDEEVRSCKLTRS